MLGIDVREGERQQTEPPQVLSNQEREQHPSSKDKDDNNNDDDNKQNRNKAVEKEALVYIFDIEATTFFMLERFLLRVCEKSSILK